MNILVLEASGAEVALAAIEIDDAVFRASQTAFSPDDARVRVVWSSNDVRSLSRELTSRLDGILTDARWKMSDVHAIAVGLGPGSWTSLRVVLATAKTLAQVRNWQIVGVPSFDGVAHAAWHACDNTSSTRCAQSIGEEAAIVVVSQSRADEIYSKVFRVRDAKWQIEQCERVQTAESLREEIRSMSDVFVTGEAASSLLDGTLNATLAPVSVEETALQIGLLAARRLANDDGDDALTLQPLYVGLSAAERNLAQKSHADVA